MSNGRTRRELLRSLTGASLFSSAVSSMGACVPPSKRLRVHSKNPPSERPVIPVGKEGEVMALIGPLAHEPPLPGWKLDAVTVHSERIEFAWSGAGAKIRIGLVALTDDPVGKAAAFATTTSFRVMLDGGAPDDVKLALGNRFTEEVRSRDRGGFWVKADDAARVDAGTFDSGTNG